MIWCFVYVAPKENIGLELVIEFQKVCVVFQTFDTLNSYHSIKYTVTQTLKVSFKKEKNPTKQKKKNHQPPCSIK